MVSGDVGVVRASKVRAILNVHDRTSLVGGKSPLELQTIRLVGKVCVIGIKEGSIVVIARGRIEFLNIGNEGARAHYVDNSPKRCTTS